MKLKLVIDGIVGYLTENNENVNILTEKLNSVQLKAFS